MARLLQMLLDFFRRLVKRPEELPAPPPEPAAPKEDTDEVTEPGRVVDDVDILDDPTPIAAPPREEEVVVTTRPVLSKGSLGENVIELQKLLNKNGESLTADGDYGSGTERVVKGFQESYGLTTSGVVNAETWAILDRPVFGKDPAYEGVPMPPSTTVTGKSAVAKAWNANGNLLAMLAGTLGINSSAACAVLAVESAGEGFWAGKMVIRFENHIFHKYWGKAHQDTFDEHFSMDASERWKDHKWRADPSDPWRELHVKDGQTEEWAVLAFARTLNDTAALNSISMGSPQIMGFNSAKVGFDTVQEMFAAFVHDERAHVLGLFDFIRSDHRMVRYLRTGDYTGFAGIYNGGGQKDYYGGKIAEKTAEATKLGIP